jgi:organic hydroperoxide reductase OsmC/OhrA
MKTHHYSIKTEWTGNQGEGTASYKSYHRSYRLSGEGKTTEILGSSDPAFLGDASKYNPEDLFLASLSACHLLWYLHLCAVNQVIVTHYVDKSTGIMLENKEGSGRFTEVSLFPTVTVKDSSMVEKAIALHHEANKMCFIANSCNFPIKHFPVIKVEE